jgi:hypothetical protein
MEQTKNEGQVALEMGNSPKVVNDHYFQIVDERAAREHRSIKPLPRRNRKLCSENVKVFLSFRKVKFLEKSLLFFLEFGKPGQQIRKNVLARFCAWRPLIAPNI